MTCREFVELVTEYLDRALAPGETARFEEHLAECPFCGRYFQQMQLTIRVLNRLDG
jgi:predicted anti-sigma-YlaC factor YlaD